MQYSTPTSPVRRSIDVASAETPNRWRYRDANCRLRLNGQGLPVAIRRVVALQKAGSMAHSRYQVVKPDGIVSLSHAALSAWEDRRARPVN